MCLLDRGQGVCMSGPMQFKPVLYKGQPLSIPLYLSPGTSIVKFILQYKLSTQDSEAKVTLNNMDSNSQKVVSFSCPAPLPTHLSVTSKVKYQFFYVTHTHTHTHIHIYIYIYYCIYSWLFWVLIGAPGLSLVLESGGYSLLRSLEHTDFRSCGTQLHSMWNLPGRGMEPMFSTLACRFLSTGPPGKSYVTLKKTTTTTKKKRASGSAFGRQQ